MAGGPNGEAGSRIPSFVPPLIIRKALPHRVFTRKQQERRHQRAGVDRSDRQCGGDLLQSGDPVAEWISWWNNFSETRPAVVADAVKQCLLRQVARLAPFKQLVTPSA